MEVSTAPELKFSWGLQNCFQVYGIKRKLLNTCSESADHINQSTAKRLCFVPSPLRTAAEQGHLHSMSELPIQHQPSTLLNNRIPCQRPELSSADDDMPTACEQARTSVHENAVNNESEMGIPNEAPDYRKWQHSKECSDLQHQIVGHKGEQEDMLHCKMLHERALAVHAEKLESQLNFLKEIHAQSNDYWAVPQENQLKMADELEQARIAMENDYVLDPYQYGCMPQSASVPGAGPNAHTSTTFDHMKCYCKPNWEVVLEPMNFI